MSPTNKRPPNPAKTAGQPDGEAPRSRSGKPQKPRGRPGAKFQKGRGPKRGRGPAAAFQERALNDKGEEIVQIFGLHAVSAALQNPTRELTELFLTENAARRLGDALSAAPPNPKTVTPKDLDKLLGSDTVHQGALLRTVVLPEPSLDDLAETASQPGGGPLVILDQITDPHNVGAILRSSAVFNASGLIITRRNSPALGGVLAKSASGALETVPVHVASNLARTITALKDAGLTVIGLDGEAEILIDEADLKTPAAIVLGAEGKGLRQLTKETCSQLCRIEASGNLTSLNVSNAAAVSLYVAAMQKRAR